MTQSYAFFAIQSLFSFFIQEYLNSYVFENEEIILMRLNLYNLRLGVD